MSVERPIPRRIQRSRTRKIPEGAVYVGNGTTWECRYKIGSRSNTLGRRVESLDEAIGLYRRVVWEAEDAPHMTAWVREQLRGKDLVCDCPLDQPCHADALIEIANRRPTEPSAPSRG